MARQKINKTNVARLLDKAKVAYELIPYEVDESDLRCRARGRPVGRRCGTCVQDYRAVW